jgi:hypothetical protein
MAEILLPWRAYAAHQSSLNNRTSVDAISWGMERGLNYLLEGDNFGADAIEVDRITANAARRDRYARSLLAQHIVVRSEVNDAVGQIEARSSFAVLRRLMPTEKLDLLVELAAGTESGHLATEHRIGIGALRTRIARAREIARNIAA